MARFRIRGRRRRRRRGHCFSADGSDKSGNDVNDIPPPRHAQSNHTNHCIADVPTETITTWWVTDMGRVAAEDLRRVVGTGAVAAFGSTVEVLEGAVDTDGADDAVAGICDDGPNTALLWECDGGTAAAVTDIGGNGDGAIGRGAVDLAGAGAGAGTGDGAGAGRLVDGGTGFGTQGAGVGVVVGMDDGIGIGAGAGAGTAAGIGAGAGTGAGAGLAEGGVLTTETGTG